MENLNEINYLNLIGFTINVLVTFFASTIFNFPDNATISTEYQTIITPAGLAFAIWGVIFLSQLIFTIVQMLPQYRSKEIVQEGVKLYYFFACIAQSLWTFVFGYEVFWLSVIVMLLIFFPLYAIVIQQTKIDASVGDFWLFQFPFQVHCGWILAAALLNLNLMFISYGANSTFQIILASLSLAIILFAAVYFLILLPHGSSSYTIPSVFTWATFGMTLELISPKELILNTFNQMQIDTFKILTACISAIILVGTISYGIYKSCSRNNRTNDDTPANESTLLVV